MKTKTKKKQRIAVPAKRYGKKKSVKKKPVVKKPLVKKPVPEYLGVKYATQSRQREALEGLVTLIINALGLSTSDVLTFIGTYDRIVPKNTKWRELWMIDALFIRPKYAELPTRTIDRTTAYGNAVMWAITSYLNCYFVKPVKGKDREIDFAQEAAEQLREALALPDAKDYQRLAVRLVQLANDHDDLSLREVMRVSLDTPYGGSFRETLEAIRGEMQYFEVTAMETSFKFADGAASREEPCLPEVKPRIDEGMYVVDANSGAILCEDGGRIYPPDLEDGEKIKREVTVFVGNNAILRTEVRVPQCSNYAEWAAFFAHREPMQAATGLPKWQLAVLRRVYQEATGDNPKLGEVMEALAHKSADTLALMPALSGMTRDEVVAGMQELVELQGEATPIISLIPGGDVPEDDSNEEEESHEEKMIGQGN